MSLISEQVEELRHESELFLRTSKLYKLLTNAADTIEELSAKLASANMDRSEQYYEIVEKSHLGNVSWCRHCGQKISWE